MAYIIGSIFGTLVKVYLCTRLTGLICRKVGVKPRFHIPSAYILYILIFWPLAFLINNQEKAISFILYDVPILMVLFVIDVMRKKNKMKLPDKFLDL